MPRVRFEDGTVLKFETPPSPRDIEEAYAAVKGTGATAPSGQSFSKLNTLQKAFYPSTFIREGLGQRVTQGLQTAQDVLGATPIGQVLASATAPPLRALAAMVPQQLGQTVGTAASLPVDPSTYAFGGVGMIPSRFMRTALGATVGGVSAAGQVQATPASLLAGTVLGGTGSALTRAGKGGIRLAETRRQRLQSAERSVLSADQQLTQAADQQVLRMRQRGDLHDTVINTLKQESEKAWSKMKSVTGAIPGTIQPDEVWQRLQLQLATKPERLSAARLFLDDLESAATAESGYQLPKSKRQFGFTASDWSDLSSEIGSFIRRAQHKGKAAVNLSELIKNDVRSAIAAVIEQRAPETHKGLVQEALFDWAGYASDRDMLFQVFSPGAHPNVSTKSGVAFLDRAVKGDLLPDEQRFMDRMIEKSGIDLPKSIQPYAQALLKAKIAQQRIEQQPTRSLIRKLLPYLVTAGGTTGIGEIIRRTTR